MLDALVAADWRTELHPVLGELHSEVEGSLSGAENFRRGCDGAAVHHPFDRGPCTLDVAQNGIAGYPDRCKIQMANPLALVEGVEGFNRHSVGTARNQGELDVIGFIAKGDDEQTRARGVDDVGLATLKDDLVSVIRAAGRDSGAADVVRTIEGLEGEVTLLRMRDTAKIWSST